MSTLTVTTRRQATFRKEILQHLGIQPGEKIEVELLPGGRIELRAAERTGTIGGVLRLLAGKTTEVASIEEISSAAAAGGAGEK